MNDERASAMVYRSSRHLSTKGEHTAVTFVAAMVAAAVSEVILLRRLTAERTVSRRIAHWRLCVGRVRLGL